MGQEPAEQQGEVDTEAQTQTPPKAGDFWSLST